MKLARHALFHYRLAYDRPVTWFRSVEEAGDFVVLRLDAEDGSAGFAEATVKPSWNGLSVRALIALLRDILLPAIARTDLTDSAALVGAMAPYPCNSLAKMLVINAATALAAEAKGQPLWEHLGGKRSLDLSWCITRQPPADMAREAGQMIERHGFAALKLKGGQGMDADRTMIRAVREVVGADILLTVDANAAYSVAQAPAYTRLLADEGVSIAEDPCLLCPDHNFARLAAQCPLPLLVDMPCASLADTDAFIASGARAISVKPGRVGLAEAAGIAQRCSASGTGVCSGMFAESAVGALLSLPFATTLSRPVVAAEQSFFLKMDQLLHTSLRIEQGRLTLPDAPGLAQLIDTERMTPA